MIHENAQKDDEPEVTYPNQSKLENLDKRAQEGSARRKDKFKVKDLGFTDPDEQPTFKSGQQVIITNNNINNYIISNPKIEVTTGPQMVSQPHNLTGI